MAKDVGNFFIRLFSYGLIYCTCIYVCIVMIFALKLEKSNCTSGISNRIISIIYRQGGQLCIQLSFIGCQQLKSSKERHPVINVGKSQSWLKLAVSSVKIYGLILRLFFSVFNHINLCGSQPLLMIIKYFSCYKRHSSCKFSRNAVAVWRQADPAVNAHLIDVFKGFVSVYAVSGENGRFFFFA